MEEKDFEFCEYVEWNMCFVTYDDFCKKRKVIKKMYQDLDKYHKRFYKWYVYANIIPDVTHKQKETYKNAIWEYLNSNDRRCLKMLMSLRGKLHSNFVNQKTYDIIRTGDKK